jgi:hypothetical protein
VLLEAHSLLVAERAFQVVGDEFDELLAGHSMCSSPGSGGVTG